ncbi:MAG: hypothetical protein K6A82_00380 [Prevotella sp.]|nr:hypothetical protein [Prevotella sp.]
MTKQVFRIVMLMVMVLLADVAKADRYEYEFTKKVFTGNETQVLDGVSWTLDMKAPAVTTGFEKVRGHRFGKGGQAATPLTLSTTEIAGTITKVTVEASGNSGISGTLTVSVGDAVFGDACALTKANTPYDFTGLAAGEVRLAFAQTSNTAVYVKKITIEYTKAGENPQGGEQQEGEEGGESGEGQSGETSEIQAVNGLAGLAAVADGSPVCLYIADSEGARVVFARGDDAFIRANSAAVWFHKVQAAPRMRYNQHIAGYITGVKQTVNGMTVFEATDKTNTARLIIADPVQEEDVKPAEITPDEIAGHFADWVMVKSLNVSGSRLTSDGQEFLLNDVYVVGDPHYTQPADQSKVNVSAILFSTANGERELRPVYNRVEATVLHHTAAQEFLPISPASEENNTTDGISSLSDDAQCMDKAHVYSLSGQFVAVGTKGLAKGIYIVNGRKLVIR